MQYVNEMMARMQYSRYTKKFRYEVVKSAVKACDTIVAADADGEGPVYRPNRWNTIERTMEKQKKKANCYKTGGYESVIFVPSTSK